MAGPLEPPAEQAEAAAGERGLVGLLTSRATIILVVGVALLGLVYYHGHFHWLQPRARLFGWFGFNLVCLFVVPVLLSWLVLRRSPRELGLRVGDWRLGLRYAGIYAAIAIPIILVASRWPSFQHYYPRYPWAREDWRLLLLAQGGWLVYFFAWEFFFRGFLLFGLAERIGALAIVVQTVPFVMMHFPKPEGESFAAIGAGLALGWMAYRTRSCVGAWLLHWVCSAAMAVAVVYWPG
jgi:membrane protease YdiL (CAAX protease family)